MDVLLVVRGLLAKAESTEYPEEAEALNAKAAQLLAKYGIDEAVARQKAEVRVEVVHKKIDILNPYSLDKLYLLRAIAEPMRVRVIRLRQRKGAGKTSAHLFGYPADIERVEMLFTSLLLQAARAMLKVDLPWGQDLRVFRRSWLHGFTEAIGERVREMESEAESAVSQELVFVADRGRIDAKVSEVYPLLVTKKRTVQLSDAGNQAGSLVGRRADLGGVRVSAAEAMKLAAGTS